MKLSEIALTEEQLDEISIRNAVAAGMLGAASLSPLTVDKAEQPHPTISQPSPIQKEIKNLAQIVLSKYRIDPTLAAEVAHSAKKHEKTSFPTAKDILAIVGVESSFNPDSVSNLRKDPAVGLMQVRPRVWNIDPSTISTVDGQIKVGAEILHQYYQKLGSKSAAIHAYNIGLTNFRRGVGLNPNYVKKVDDEKRMYEVPPMVKT